MMQISNVVAAILALVLSSSAAQTQTLGESFELFPGDGAAFAQFGASVAAAGSTVVIGAPNDNGSGLSSGSAYLFNVLTGLPIAKLLANDGTDRDFLGVSVAISGTLAIVGATGDDDNGSASGSAYLFDTGTGQQLLKLLPSDGVAGDIFGMAVSMSGSIALVGASAHGQNGVGSGAAYLFDTGSGQQLAKLLPSDGAAFDAFGFSVATNGAVALVGASGCDDNGVNSGAAYLFDTSTGQQIAKLLPADGSALDAFGGSVALTGTLAIIGASNDDENGTSSGSAYVFDISTEQQIAKLLPSDGKTPDTFGGAVAISGSTALVGAHNGGEQGVNSGAAYLFDVASGTQLAKLLPSDGSFCDFFAFDVALDSGIALAGSMFDDDNGSDAGSLYVFDLEIASTAINNGAGGNPVVLTDAGVAPVLNLPWPAMVDTATSGHAVSSCVWYADSVPPGTIIINAGEVIADLSTTNAWSNTVVGSGMNDHSVVVPNNLTLLGTSLTVQAILYSGGPSPLLGNALDITVGF